MEEHMPEANNSATMERLDWQSAVKKGLRLARSRDRSAWTLGDLALELFPPRGEGGGVLPLDVGGEVRTLSDFADAIDVHPGTLSNLRSCSVAWPPEKRRPVSEVAWATHRALAAHPDRFKLIHEGMKRAEATELVAKLRAQANTARDDRGHFLSPTLVPAQRAVREAQSAATILSEKREDISAETRQQLIQRAQELRAAADEIMAALGVPPVAEVKAAASAAEQNRAPWYRRTLRAA